jgi:hypothetical protein
MKTPISIGTRAIAAAARSALIPQGKEAGVSFAVEEVLVSNVESKINGAHHDTTPRLQSRSSHGKGVSICFMQHCVGLDCFGTQTMLPSDWPTSLEASHELVRAHPRHVPRGNTPSGNAIEAGDRAKPWGQVRAPVEAQDHFQFLARLRDAKSFMERGIHMRPRE